jgi:GH35 family endo-1,4-beta-xylanase
MNRRAFLATLAAAATGCKTWHERPAREESIATAEPASGLGAEEVDAPTMRDGAPALRIQLREADGSPLAAERMKLLHARDSNNDPLPQAIATATGRARVQLSRSEPIQISCRLKVPGFGEVYCYADNQGRGYAKPGNIDFADDAAETRVLRVTHAYEELRHQGVVLPGEFHQHLNAARASKYPYERLAHGLHAGELLTLAAAQHRISKLEPRKDFLFGVMVSGWNALGPKYEQAIRELFNFATVSWYSWKPQPPTGDELPIDYGRMDGSVDWCLQRNITPKNFGYLYMTRGATPEWIRPIESPATTQSTSTTRRAYQPNWTYEKLRALYPRIIRTTAQRYHDRVPFMEVMNEAHDKANLWQMSQQQVLEMACLAFKAAREGSPKVKRQMNHCCLWAEYAKNRNADGSRRWSPFQFVKTCFDNSIDYEVIGLQLYYPQHDLFEIERMLDRFAVFNKPIHITELATASQSGLDANSMRPNTEAPMWHEPGWSPSSQADWVSSIYTLLYSKAYMQAVGWWDLSDVKGHFWPFGGLLDKNLNPKESYLRLKRLQETWAVGPSTRRA